MACKGTSKKLLAAAIGAATAILTFTATESTAHAAGPVTATGKGVVGGALLGIETVDITMGIIGVEKGWPYFVFGGLGGVGGGIGGFFVERVNTKNGGPAEPALYMLAGGMALIIPTLVVSLNATAYKPPDSDQKEPVQNQPADPAMPKTQAKLHKVAPRTAAARPYIPMSLVDVNQGKVAIGIPAFRLEPLYNQHELATYGVAQGTQVHFPVFQAMF